jgi:hypothetical protein
VEAAAAAAGTATPGLPELASVPWRLREDEAGFATVANLAFGAPRRVRARLDARARPALDAAVRAARLDIV